MKADHPVTLSDVLSVFTNMLPPKSDLLGTQSRKRTLDATGPMEVKSLSVNLSSLALETARATREAAEESKAALLNPASMPEQLEPTKAGSRVPPAQNFLEASSRDGVCRVGSVSGSVDRHTSEGLTPRCERSATNQQQVVSGLMPPAQPSLKSDDAPSVSVLSESSNDSGLSQTEIEDQQRIIRELSAQYRTEVMGEPEPIMCCRCESNEVKAVNDLCGDCDEELADGRWVNTGDGYIYE